MKLFKVTIKKNSNDQRDWGDHYYLVVASSFGNAEDKAEKFRNTHGIMQDITFVGDITRDPDVILLKDRFS